MKAFVYRNNTDILYPKNSYVKIKLVGNKNNVNAIGSSVTLYSGKSKYYLEQILESVMAINFSSLKKFHASEVSDKKQLLYHEALNGIL